MNKIQQQLHKLVKQAQAQKNASIEYYLEKFNNIVKELKKSVEFGSFDQKQVKIIILTGLIIFAGYFVLVKQYYYENFLAINRIKQKTSAEIRKEILQKDLQGIVMGHPIEKMLPYIAEKDTLTVAYLIGIAKKESNWGKRKPVLDGQDCYNYWGFRAQRERMGSGGHTCFDSPKEAVDAVAKRIDQIIERNDVQSAKNMIVWKCGSNCAVTGGQAAADKWIEDVDFYAKKVLN